MNVEEKNRMVAEFMGVEFTKIGERFMASPTPNEVGSCWEEQLKYHTSWEWIMPVVEEISDVKGWSFNGTLDWLSDKYDMDGLYSINDIYRVCVEFITDHMKNKKS